MLDPLVSLVFSVSLALLFFMASRHKFESIRHFEAQLGAYDIVPKPLLPAVARVLPWIEMSVVFLLFIPFTRVFAAAVCVVLLVAYALGMAVNLYRGRTDIDCGCGAKPQSLSVWLLLRNLVLAFGALVIAIPTVDRGLMATDLVFVVLFTATLAMAYMTMEELVRNYSAIIKEE